MVRKINKGMKIRKKMGKEGENERRKSGLVDKKIKEKTKGKMNR